MANHCREPRREAGRFVSAYGMHVIAGPAASPYRRLVLDRDWRPVGPLNEWYRLRAGVGAPSTRDTYLRVPKKGVRTRDANGWPRVGPPCVHATGHVHPARSSACCAMPVSTRSARTDA